MKVPSLKPFNKYMYVDDEHIHKRKFIPSSHEII